MSIAKATVTGTIFRTPEKRYTSNDIAVTSFVLDIGEKEEMLIRVISKRPASDPVLADVQKGDKILIEGRLQIANAKMDDGSERKIYEIDASVIEKMSASASGSGSTISTVDDKEIVKFAQEEFDDELISEDEIPF